MLDGMLNMRIKCYRMIRSAELCPVRDKLLFVSCLS